MYTEIKISQFLISPTDFTLIQFTKTVLIRHSVENCSKTRSQFFWEMLQFFRQTETNLSISSFYYIKPLWENANSNFLGNFGPGFSIDINRGGFDLPFGVKKPDLDGFVQNL